MALEARGEKLRAEKERVVGSGKKIGKMTIVAGRKYAVARKMNR